MADEETNQYYEAHAVSYGSVTPYGSFITHRDEFAELLPPKGNVLDLGCGGGHASEAFLGAGFEVVALDGSREIAKFTSQRLGIEVVVKDFAELDYCSEFDGVWAAASLTHVPMTELGAVLKLVRAALRKSGLLVASFKCAEEDWRDMHGRLFGAASSESLRRVATESGFSVDRVDLVPGSGRTNESTSWAWIFATRSD